MRKYRWLSMRPLEDVTYEDLRERAVALGHKWWPASKRGLWDEPTKQDCQLALTPPSKENDE